MDRRYRRLTDLHGMLIGFLQVWQPKEVWTSPKLRGHDISDDGTLKEAKPIVRPSRAEIRAALTPG